MKEHILVSSFLIAFSSILTTSTVSAKAICEVVYPKCAAEDTGNVLSEKYWKAWEAEMARIDADIEKYRKSDAEVKLENPDTNSFVKIEQIKSEFNFGAPAFYFNRAGDKYRNEAYRNLWGDLFNQATIPFYWKFFELKDGKPRFKNSAWDEEEFLNKVGDTNLLPHPFSPATDELISFLKTRGIRIHGHPLVWGNKRWNVPEFEWLIENYADDAAKAVLKNKAATPPLHKPLYVDEKFKKMSTEDAESLFGNYAGEMEKTSDRRIRQIAAKYADSVDSWDVVNESCIDYESGALEKSKKVCMSLEYGIMPGDYACKAFKIAEKLFPKSAMLSINDYHCGEKYGEQIRDMLSKGCKIDMIGFQRHLWNTDQMKKIAGGEDVPNWSIKRQREILDRLDSFGLPIHISEVTVLPTERTPDGFKAQAAILRNYYKLWFSYKNVSAITYWRTIDKLDKNVRDRDEPYFAGILFPDATKKPAYFALDDLINREWKTCLELKPDENGTVKFRGFKGKYKIVWRDTSGNIRTKIVSVR